MSRRYRQPFNGKQFIGNTNTNEVHDLDNEQSNCRIDQIKNEHIKTFIPDSHLKAKNEGFDNCYWCIGNSNY